MCNVPKECSNVLGAITVLSNLFALITTTLSCAGATLQICDSSASLTIPKNEISRG